MPGCILRVGGRSFDPEALLNTLCLRANRTWRIGQPFSKSRRYPNRVHKNSGFQCDVSRAHGDLRQQMEEAEAFLSRHLADLSLIAANPQIEFCDLDFGYYCRLGKTRSRSAGPVVAVQGEYLPSSFLRLVGELRIGVALSMYPNPELNEE